MGEHTLTDAAWVSDDNGALRDVIALVLVILSDLAWKGRRRNGLLEKSFLNYYHNIGQRVHVCKCQELPLADNEVELSMSSRLHFWVL